MLRMKIHSRQGVASGTAQSRNAQEITETRRTKRRKPTEETTNEEESVVWEEER